MDVSLISERFWLVPACEPSALLTAFLERFQSACLLAQQLPAMKPEQLKSMVRKRNSLSLCGYNKTVLLNIMDKVNVAVKACDNASRRL